jgi:SNF family Na+-dependent transporter
MSAIVGRVTGITGIDSNGTHITGQFESYEKANGWCQNNFSVAIGLTVLLTNQSICADIANAVNDAFSTSWASTDVTLLAGLTLLST